MYVKRLMTWRIAITFVLAFSAILICYTSAFPKPQTDSVTVKIYHFRNGNWFDGQAFKKRDFYSVGGVFVDKAPKLVNETVDLDGAYVLPPFGEAHNHNVELKYTLDGMSEKYLTDGVFYVKNPNSIPRFTKEIRGKVSLPGTIDVVFANGGLTATGGHPSTLYKALATSAYRFAGIADYENEAYWIIDTPADLESKWARILADKPDFIKTYLLDSEEYEKRRDDAKYNGAKGLNPKLLPLIVEKAHRQRLRVSTHVNTAADFHNAVIADVDEINHLPGRMAPDAGDFDRYRITEGDARLAAKKGIFVVPTYSLLLSDKNKDANAVEMTKEVQRANLRLLLKHRVRIAFGTDNYSRTSLTEALHLKDLGVFDNLTLIKMWSETTPQTIFPGRKIGRLREGYEASFIALGGNPLADFSQVKNIKWRFKQGYPMNISAKKP